MIEIFGAMGLGMILGAIAGRFVNIGDKEPTTAPVPNYGNTGPLDIDRIAALIESGALVLEPPKAGTVIKICKGDFLLHVLIMGWHWLEDKEVKDKGFQPAPGFHACRYGWGEGISDLSLTPAGAKRLEEAKDKLAANKIDALFQHVELNHHEEVINKL